MCFLVAFLLGMFIKKMPVLPISVSKGKQAKLWVGSIRALAADRIAELPPICQLGFVQSSLVL